MIDLLNRTDPYEDHPAFRFFLYYQVFESLIQEMFEEYYAEFSRMAVDPKFGRASAMRDLVEGLNKSLNEKYHRSSQLLNPKQSHLRSKAGSSFLASLTCRNDKGVGMGCGTDGGEPQGLKPASWVAIGATAEAEPFRGCTHVRTPAKQQVPRLRSE